MISAGMGIRFRRLIRVGAWHLHSIEDDGSVLSLSRYKMC